MAFPFPVSFRRSRGDDEAALTDPFFRLQHEMNRLFDESFVGFPRTARGLTPSIDVRETDKEIEITAELPGVDEKDLDIEVVDNMLTIRGEKKFERDEEEKGGYRVMERSYGTFARSMTLPFDVDENHVEAVFSKGVLKITVPKPAELEAKTKRVQIRSK